MRLRVEWGLVLCLLTSLCLQIPLMLWTHVPYYDEATYFDVARGIIHTGLPYRSINDLPGTLYFFHPPLVRYLSAFALWIWGEKLLVARSLSTAASVLLLSIFYHFIQKLWGSRYAFFFGLLLGTHSLFLVFAHSNYVETILTLFCFSGFVFVDRKQYSWAIVCFSLAILCKYHAIFYIVPLAVSMHWQDRRKAFLVLSIPLATLALWWMTSYMIEPLAFVEDLQWAVRQAMGLGEYATTMVSSRNFLLNQVVPSLGITLLLAPLALFYFLRKKEDLRSISIPSVWHAAIILLLVGLVSFGVSYKVIRYFIPVLPLWFLCLAALTHDVEVKLSSKKVLIAMFMFTMWTSSPLSYFGFKASKSIIGRPKEFGGIYAEALKYDGFYRGITEMSVSLKERSAPKDLFAAVDDVANRLVFYTGRHMCNGDDCRRAKWIVYNPESNEQREILSEQVGSLSDFELIQDFPGLGGALEHMTLFQKQNQP